MSESTKVLKHYKVVIEAMVPTILEYYVQAYSAEEAADIHSLKKIKPALSKPIQPKTIYRKVTVFDRGMSIIRFVKNLI